MKHVMPFLFLTVFLNACAATGPRLPEKFFISAEAEADLLPLSDFYGEAVLTQAVEGKYGDKTVTMTGITKISSEEMLVIGLADIGRAFTISYTAAGIEDEYSPFMPKDKIKAEYILSDIQLIYFPLAKIKSGLPDNIEVQGKPLQREFFHNGEKIITITYSAEDIFKADIRFVNLERGYSYNIRNLQD